MSTCSTDQCTQSTPSDDVWWCSDDCHAAWLGHPPEGWRPNQPPTTPHYRAWPLTYTGYLGRAS